MSIIVEEGKAYKQNKQNDEFYFLVLKLGEERGKEIHYSLESGTVGVSGGVLLDYYDVVKYKITLL